MVCHMPLAIPISTHSWLVRIVGRLSGESIDLRNPDVDPIVCLSELTFELSYCAYIWVTRPCILPSAHLTGL